MWPFYLNANKFGRQKLLFIYKIKPWVPNKKVKIWLSFTAHGFHDHTVLCTCTLLYINYVFASFEWSVDNVILCEHSELILS